MKDNYRKKIFEDYNKCLKLLKEIKEPMEEKENSTAQTKEPIR